MTRLIVFDVNSRLLSDDPQGKEALDLLSEKGYDLAQYANEAQKDSEKTARTQKKPIKILPAQTGQQKKMVLEHLTQQYGRENIVVVGDRFGDFSAAKEARIVSVALLHGDEAEKQHAFATYTAQSFDEVIAFCDQIAVYAKILENIRRKKTVRCLGINGVDTSGKTEFSARLAAFLQSQGIKTQLVHIDDFHNPEAVRRTGENEIEAYKQNAFDYQTLIAEILLPLSKGQTIEKEILLLDVRSDRYSIKKKFVIDHQTLVILEGVLLFRAPVADYIDYKIFLDIDFSEVIARATLRDVPRRGIEILDRYRQKYIPIQKWYLKTYNPRKNSDLVIDNTDFSHPVVL